MSERAVQFAEKMITGHETVLSAADYLLPRLPRTTVEQSRSRELDHAQEWLDQGNSLMVYFGPHTAIFDPVLLHEAMILPELRRDPEQRFAWFVSTKLTGDIPGQSVGIFTEVAKYHTDKRGIEILPVVQDYVVEEGIVDEETAKRINRNSAIKAMMLLHEPSSILAISPEGTRKQTGGMLRAKPDIGRLLDNTRARRHNARASEDDQWAHVAALPVYVEGAYNIQDPKHTGLSHFNPFSSVRFSVGDLITHDVLEEVQGDYLWRDESMGEFTIADAMMMHLLDRPTSPWKKGEDPRGVYAWKNLIDCRTLPYHRKTEPLL